MKKLKLKRFEDLSEVNNYEEIAMLEQMLMKGGDGGQDSIPSPAPAPVDSIPSDSTSGKSSYKYINIISGTVSGNQTSGYSGMINIGGKWLYNNGYSVNWSAGVGYNTKTGFGVSATVTINH